MQDNNALNEKNVPNPHLDYSKVRWQEMEAFRIFLPSKFSICKKTEISTFTMWKKEKKFLTKSDIKKFNLHKIFNILTTTSAGFPESGRMTSTPDTNNIIKQKFANESSKIKGCVQF